MSWSTELIVKYKTLNDMITAGNITGIDKVENGTIAIVEEDNNNSYIFNGIIRKWKPRHGNIYSSTNLPSSIDYNNDIGIEIWDTTYKLKRRWIGTEWELQKDVTDLMLCGYGQPSIDVGEYGNYYTDLNNNKIYSRNILSQTKLDLLSLYDSGSLTWSVSSGYTISYPRNMFVNKIGVSPGDSSWVTVITTETTGLDGYMTFDFHGNPVKISTIYMGFNYSSSVNINTFTWFGSNDLNTGWENLGSCSSDISYQYRSIQCAPLTEYRYYRCYWDTLSNGSGFNLLDMWFYVQSNSSNWSLVNEPQNNQMYFNHGIPNVNTAIENSICIDIDTNNIYKKNILSFAKMNVSSVVGRSGASNWIDGSLTTYTSGASIDIFNLGSSYKIDRIILKRYVGYILNCYYFVLFGSNDNVIWDLIHQQGNVDGDVSRDITININNVNNRNYQYFRINHNCNSRLTEIEFYSSSLIEWGLIGNLTQLNTSSFNNKLNSSIVSPQLLAEYINTQNPTVNITTDRTITSSEFNLNTKFKVINTEPLLITLPDLTSDFNNRTIEIIKLGKGDLVITTNMSSIGRPNNKVIINNTGVIGESIIIEYVHELTMYVVKNLGLTWLNTISLPTYPNIQSVTVGEDGITWSLVFSLDMISGADGYNSGLSISSLTMGVHTLTYVSGFETDTLIYTSNKYIDNTDTFPLGLSYTQPGQGINSIENNSIKSFSNFTVTNNSMLTCPQITSATIGNNGLTWSFVFNRNMNVGPLPNAFSVTMTIAGVINLTYSSGDGTNTLNYTGNVIITSGDSVSVGLNYSDTNKSLKDVDYQLILKSFTNFTVTNQSSV